MPADALIPYGSKSSAQRAAMWQRLYLATGDAQCLTRAVEADPRRILETRWSSRNTTSARERHTQEG